MSRARHYALVLLFVLTSSANADVVRILDDPREALQARADVIRQAERRISIMYFLARDDRVTLAVLSLLGEAKKRGVADVRILLDGSFHRIPKGILAELREQGVEVRVYHPLDIRHPSWMFRRMHEKLIVADSRRYIAGGRNLGEAYFGLARKNYVDRDVYVEGESAADAQAHFDAVWASKEVAELRMRVPHAEKRSAAARLDRGVEILEQNDGIDLDTPTDWSAGREDAGTVEFLHDPVDDNGERVGVRLGEIIEAARSSILIESPYFVPSKPLRQLLAKKVADGVKVTVVTNSLRSTDGLLPQVAYLKYRRRLIRAGVDMHEYKGPDPLHAKSIVVDGHTAMIGSYNVDPRSQYLNTEIVCVVNDEAFAQELEASIESHMQHSWAMHRRERGPRVSRSMSLRIFGARLILPLVEGQL